MKKLTAFEHQELLMQHQSRIEDIRFSKKWLWSIVNYVLLLFAALIWVDTQLKMYNSDIGCILILLAISTCALSIYYIIDTQRAMTIYRKNIKEIRQYLSAVLNNGASALPENYDKSTYDFPRYALFLVVIIIVALALTILILAK